MVFDDGVGWYVYHSLNPAPGADLYMMIYVGQASDVCVVSYLCVVSDVCEVPYLGVFSYLDALGDVFYAQVFRLLVSIFFE